jgi:hypothetical protein
MLSELFGALKAMDFKKVSEILEGIDILTLLINPWAIVFMIGICIVLLIRRGYRAVVTFLSIPALMVLLRMTVQGSNITELEYSPVGLLIFVGGFLVIAAVNIYLYFVR